MLEVLWLEMNLQLDSIKNRGRVTSRFDEMFILKRDLKGMFTTIANQLIDPCKCVVVNNLGISEECLFPKKKGKKQKLISNNMAKSVIN